MLDSVQQANNLSWVRKALSGVENSYAEAIILISFVSDISKEDIILGDISLSEIQIQTLQDLIKQRNNHVPIAYLIGKKEFYSRDFIIDGRVLIPRPDTEILVDAVLNSEKEDSKKNILDLGCGSGCIGITLALEMANSNVTLLDIDEGAIDVSHKNLSLYSICGRARCIKSSWKNKQRIGKFDIIVANPPYVGEKDKTENIKFEPKSAIFAKDDGYEHYYHIAEFIKHNIISGGKIFLEIGYNQAEKIKEIFSSYKYIKSYHDLNGHERCMEFNAS